MLDGDDGAEDLVLHDLGVLRHIGHDAWAIEEAAIPECPAAGRDLGPVLPRPVHEAGDAVLLALADQRTHVELGVVGGVPDLERLDRRDEVREHVVVDLAAGDDAGGRRAVLARVEEAGQLDRLREGFEIRVLEDQHRGLAAELEMDALDGLGGARGDLLARGGVAG